MSQTVSVPARENLSDSKEKFDIQKYFDRIKYTGTREATIETLRAIHLHHAQTIPFENLNPFLRIPVVLDIDSLYQKLILNRRGGYCFEHNLLLMHVLKSLGFSIKGLAARVLWNQPEGTITARGHMLLFVDINGQHFIADVGFGGLTLTAPLWHKFDIEQQTPHERFKFTQTGNETLLEAKVQGIWKRIYSFSLQENFLPDYEVASWYLSNHPTSHFVTGLIAALPFDKGRHALRNNDFVTHYLDGTHERKRFNNVADLRHVLETTFGIIIPHVENSEALFSRIIS
ncbi:arylamine N-acetyltransferase [Chryseolinea sp. H1M3-3]|uniref:arylamine N-acetyltransferase family protein n=1 Tax=Chryseolinea sp. H1M3-3 TaxID=3034144 RepID=UPI0023EDC58C|nr:arylamine N-acetyltransferase [Chryseolinea sp. H1M3-3]